MRNALLTATAVLILISGCGPSGPVVYRRSGTITFNGKTVPMGKIYFEPDVSAGGSGPSGFADIVNGKYDTDRGGGKGSSSGPTLVRVLGHADENKDPVSGFGPPLFAEYQSKTDLPAKASEFDLDVPASAAKGLPKKTVPLDP